MRDVVNGDGLTEPAHAPHFNVDDLARPKLQCSLRVAPAVNGFVQADAGLELFLQPGVKVKIIVPEWLFDHQEVESVKLLQVVDLVERISGIGIATEHDLRPACADFLEDLNVPARFALDLDSAVARVQLGLDFLQQLLVRVLYANGNATRNFFLRSAQQLPQRDVARLRFRIPQRIFHRALGHAMAAHFAEQSNGLARAINIFSQKRRSKIALRGIPGCINRLFTIERVFTRDAFSPAFRPVRMNGEQKDAAFRGAAKAGLKEMHQRHMDLTQGNGFNFQRNSLLAAGN